VKYLLVRLGSLGDVIHAIPAVAALRAHDPSARIDWLVDPRYVSVVRMVRGVDHVIPLDPRGDKLGLLFTLSGLRRTRYDAVFDVQGLIKSAVLTWLAGAKRTYGMPPAHLRERAAQMFYTDTPDLGEATHVIDKGLALVGQVGAKAVEPAFPLDVPASGPAREVVAHHRAGFALLNPGAAWPNKQWPAERFGALAARLRADHDLPSVVLWAPAERERAQQVVATSEGAATLAPETRITDLFALAQAARLMVSGDTGPLHIACAVGTPVVALFGPTSAGRNGPWSHEDRVIARTSQCECLYQRQCRRATRCIDDIPTSEVVAAASDRLSLARV
jgi:lipopolysaccharide heptosyltransferase I